MADKNRQGFETACLCHSVGPTYRFSNTSMTNFNVVVNESKQTDIVQKKTKETRI